MATGPAAGIAPASAQGTTIGGTGADYYLNDAFTGQANRVFTYGTDWTRSTSATGTATAPTP
jgi:hypothetical protein